MMNMSYLNARFVLGWALIKHLLLRPFVRRDPRHWIGRVAADHLAPTPQQGWALFEGASRCVGCGLCDAVVPADVHASHWLAGSIRQPQDAPLALAQAAALRRHQGAIEAVCPTRVRVGDVVRLIELQAQALRGAPADAKDGSHGAQGDTI